jgi:hypothetical protein
MIVQISYKFFIRQKDPARLLIFFGVKDILNPIHLLSIAEEYLIQMCFLKPKIEQKKFENEKQKFLEYLKSCISLFLISSFNEIKQILEELKKNDCQNNTDKSGLMDIVSNDINKYKLSNSSNNAYRKEEKVSFLKL